MTPITWLSCLVTLWIIVVDTQAGTVDPLVLAVYSPKYDEVRLTFADLTNAKNKNWKLPLDAAEPRYFVLYCGQTVGNPTEYTRLIAQRITAKIDSKARNMKCDHLPLPSIVHYGTHDYSTSISVYTGYFITLGLWGQAKEIESSTVLTSFKEDYERILKDTRGFNEYLDKIMYNYKYSVPQYISHKITARMHSNTYEKKCEEIRFDTFTVDSMEYNLDTLHNIEVPNYEWRQLVPMQDFMGIYATKATCIYLNYLLLHKKVIKSLKKVENFIRDVADIVNEIHVESGTYTPEEEISFIRNEANQTIIPSIVWKKITHRGSSTNYYSVVIVIHNTETERICEHDQEIENLGLPKYDNKQNQINTGVMYYCLANDTIRRLLDYNRNEAEEPLNWNNLRTMRAR